MPFGKAVSQQAKKKWAGWQWENVSKSREAFQTTRHVEPTVPTSSCLRLEVKYAILHVFKE